MELRQLERQWDDYKVTHLNHMRLIHTAAAEHGAVLCMLEYPSFYPKSTQTLKSEQPPVLLLWSCVASRISPFCTQ